MWVVSHIVAQPCGPEWQSPPEDQCLSVGSGLMCMCRGFLGGGWALNATDIFVVCNSISKSALLLLRLQDICGRVCCWVLVQPYIEVSATCMIYV